MPPLAPAAPYGPQTLEIRRFLQRLAALPPAEWDAIAADYDGVQRGPRFAGADRALSAAVAATQRERERDAVLGPLLQLVAGPLPEHAPAEEPPPLALVAEAALAAVLALLVRDVLGGSAFATLYAPFAERIPLATLGAGANPSGPSA